MLEPDDAVGHMLQAQWDYVEGTIARHGALDDYEVGDWTERFYHQAPDRWRLELSTDLTYVSNGQEAVVIAEGRVLHRGRPRIPVGFVTESLLYPGRAPIWDWPDDEGWSLVLAESRRTPTGTTIPIAGRGEPGGELHVVLPSGHLDYLQLGDEISRITDLRERPTHPAAFDVQDKR